VTLVNPKKAHIKVCLILKDRGWILEKMATRLIEQLPNWNVAGEIVYEPSPTADVNHWMYYNDLQGDLFSRNTLFITHVDRPIKLYILKQRLKKADVGICMSRMTLNQLISSDIPPNKLCYITPAHDGNVKPKRIVIGITSQIRSDGAKREHILVKMAQTIRLDIFHFEILGPNWGNVIPYFEAAGATVNYTAGSNKDNVEYLRLVREYINRFDYYLYMGWDEGSMGFLDALAAGIPTIVTPQGFHLDINGGITYPFIDSKQLCSIFEKLATERQLRIDSVSRLTWSEYARKHALVWHALVEGQREDMNRLLHDEDNYGSPLPDLSMRNWKNSEATVKIKGNKKYMVGDIILLWEYYTKTQFNKSWMYRLTQSMKRLLRMSGKQ
jgi:hypothetical protein